MRRETQKLERPMTSTFVAAIPEIVDPVGSFCLFSAISGAPRVAVLPKTLSASTGRLEEIKGEGRAGMQAGRSRGREVDRLETIFSGALADEPR